MFNPWTRKASLVKVRVKLTSCVFQVKFESQESWENKSTDIWEAMKEGWGTTKMAGSISLWGQRKLSFFPRLCVLVLKIDDFCMSFCQAYFAESRKLRNLLRMSIIQSDNPQAASLSINPNPWEAFIVYYPALKGQPLRILHKKLIHHKFSLRSCGWSDGLTKLQLGFVCCSLLSESNCWQILRQKVQVLRIFTVSLKRHGLCWKTVIIFRGLYLYPFNE